MNWINAFIRLLLTECETPQPFGILHISFFILILALTIFLCLRYRNASDDRVRRLLAVIWLVFLCTECGKQLMFGIYHTECGYSYDYPWYIFPFQLCSSPFYTLPLVIFRKAGKICEAAVAFLALFSLFAGLSVYLCPIDIFCMYTYINHQTLLHHGLQIAIGFFLLIRSHEKLRLSFYLKGFILFACLTFTALILDLLAPYFTHETFNMFFISPYGTCGIPILSQLQQILPYPLFFLSYILGIGGVVYGFYMLLRVCIRFFSRFGKKQLNVNTKAA